MSKSAIRIAGGGIAGLTAAINLACAGYEVEVFERKKKAGGRFKGDLQGLENWTTRQDVLEELQGMNLKINFDCSPLPPLSMTDGRKPPISFSFDRSLCYLVKRGVGPGTLDQGLQQQCQDLGVRIHFGQALDPAEADIVATGPRKREIFAIDKGIKFKTNNPDMAVALVNDKAAYKGYAYLLITDGYGCICNVMFRRFKQIHGAFEQTLDIFNRFVDLDMQDVQTVGGIGCFSGSVPFRDKQRLFVGEAAGLQDFLFGFGIRLAMRSGYLAAQSIIHQIEYEVLARDQFDHLLKAGVVNRFLYEKISFFNRSYMMMGKLVRSRKNSVDFMRKAYKFTPIHQMVYPIAVSSMKRKYPQLNF
jgi:flavin-dependent dehydrogenase